MDIINNQTIAFVIRTYCQATGITCNEVVNVLCIEFVLVSLLLELFRGDTFSSLKSATNQGDNLFPRGLLIIRRV